MYGGRKKNTMFLPLNIVTLFSKNFCRYIQTAALIEYYLIKTQPRIECEHENNYVIYYS